MNLRRVLMLSLVLLLAGTSLHAQDGNRKPHHPGTPTAGETPRFKFAIVTDRTGGRPKGETILYEAVDEINLLDPDFTICVGDLINGYITDAAGIAKQ